MKDALKSRVGVVDDRGIVVASNDYALIGTQLESFSQESVQEGGCFRSGGCTFRPLPVEGVGFEYAAFVQGTDSAAESLCTIISVAFSESKSGYDEKHNKAAFIKNIISDNILPGDVYVRAKELHFSTDDPRIVVLVRQRGEADVTAVELVQKLFPDRQNEFVLSVNDNDIAIVLRLQDGEDISPAFEAAETVRQALLEQLGINTVVGVSTVAHHLRELADRYKESQVAIDVGLIFEADKNIISYASLGLGRIIYQLPTTLCEMFLNEVFKKSTIDSLDEDTLETINRFFENNLNVSETSRKLYVHRNTLVYRLEKIKKLTGLDLREFDHAIVFKVAMMVKMYLDSLNYGNRY